MSAVALIEGDRMEISAIGRPVTVASHCTARLMYYLSCVCTVVDCSDHVNIRFTDHESWHRLTSADNIELLRLCTIYSPDLLEGRGFIESDQMCPVRSNQFYQLSKINHRIIVSESVIISGQQTRVLKIMAYKRNWMQRNYQTPYNELKLMVKRQNEGMLIYNYYPTTQQTPVTVKTRSSTKKWMIACASCCCCIIICVVVSVIVGIVNSNNSE